jgi:hypothetical protein
MTENTAPVAADAVDDGDRKKKLIVVGGAVGAVVLAGAGYLLLSGGGSDNADYGLQVPKGKPAAVKAVTPAKTTKKSVVPTTKLPAASTVRIGRDPFHALYLVPAPVTVTTTPAKTDVPAGGGTTPTGTTTTGGTTTTPATTPAKAPTTTQVATTYALKLVRVYGAGKDTTGVFSVAGKGSQIAKQGTQFGKRGELKVLSLQQTAKGVWTASLQVGDDDPFEAVLGTTYYVA